MQFCSVAVEKYKPQRSEKTLGLNASAVKKQEPY